MNNIVLDPIVEEKQLLSNDKNDKAHLVFEGASVGNEFKTAKELGLPGGSVVESFVFGNEIQTLCGRKIIAQKDPSKLPLCEECRDVANSLGWRY